MKLWLAVIAILVRAETVDRLAVTVGDQIITEQEVMLHLRTAAFLNRVPLTTTVKDKRLAAQKLIEQTLIRIEMQNNNYPQPNEAEVDEMYNSVVKQRFGSADKEFVNRLGKYSISDSEFRDALRQQLAILSFIDFRFRPAVQIPEEEIHESYDADFVKETPGKEKQSYDAARASIIEVLTQQRIDTLLDRWLNQAETATRVRWMDAVFAESGK